MQLNFATYQTAFAVTPSDSAGNQCRAIYVGVAGDVAVITAGGNTVTFKAVPAGVTLPIECTQIKSTGTTATSLVGLA